MSNESAIVYGIFFIILGSIMLFQSYLAKCKLGNIFFGAVIVYGIVLITAIILYPEGV